MVGYRNLQVWQNGVVRAMPHALAPHRVAPRAVLTLRGCAPVVVLRSRQPMSAGEVSPAGRPPLANELHAAARVIGNKCFDENLDFMKCKQGKGPEPSACAAEGESVHKCVYALYKDINSKAAKEFKDYAMCLDGSDLQLAPCKKYQEAFETAFYAA